MPSVNPPAKAAPLPVLLPQFSTAFQFASERDVPHHSHPGSELVLVTEGACTCEIGVGGPRLFGRKGTLFIQPAGLSHNQRHQKFTRTTCIMFDVLPAQFDTTARIIQIADKDPFHGWTKQICELAVTTDPAARHVASVLLLACLEQLKALEHRKQRHEALPPALARVVVQLEANPTVFFPTRELARLAGLSVSHMNLLFRKQFGCSPLHYQQEKRLLRAQTLLLNPYTRVNEVATACGYEDTNYFVRLFTRQFGVSPGAWRKSLQTLP